MANGREQQWRRSPRYHGCTGFGIVLGNVADEADTKRLAGLEWCELRLEFKCIATSCAGRRAMPPGCRCSRPCRVSTNASAGWSSMRCGPTEGPRSLGAPTVDSGPDQVIGIDDIATLNAVINAPNG